MAEEQKEAPTTRGLSLVKVYELATWLNSQGVTPEVLRLSNSYAIAIGEPQAPAWTIEARPTAIDGLYTVASREEGERLVNAVSVCRHLRIGLAVKDSGDTYAAVVVRCYECGLRLETPPNEWLGNELANTLRSIRHRLYEQELRGGAINGSSEQ